MAVHYFAAFPSQAISITEVSTSVLSRVLKIVCLEIAFSHFPLLDHLQESLEHVLPNELFTFAIVDVNGALVLRSLLLAHSNFVS